MTYENVQLTYPNMTGDRLTAYFYSFSNGLLLQKNKTTGSVVSSYPADQYLGSVSCVQFDGVYYWTLERQTGGCVIKKWLIQSGILKRQSIFSFANNNMLDYDAYCFVPEYYGTSLNNTAYFGSTSVPVSDTSIFNIGDTVVIGPSSYSGFENNYDTATIVSKGASSLIISAALKNYYTSGDGIYTTRFFYLFNKYAPFDTSKGSLLKYRFNTGRLVSFSASEMFSNVKASCFYENKILFVKGNEVIHITPATMALYKHMAVDNLDTTRGETLETHALWAYSNTLYSLRGKYVYYSVGGDVWVEEDWSPKYNYVASSLLPVRFFIELKAEPQMIYASGSETSNITVRVLDQYRIPMQNQAIVMSTSAGSISPGSGLTDSEGEFSTVYTGSTSETEVQIKATVS